MPHPTDRLKFRYVWKHRESGELDFRFYSIDAIEFDGLSNWLSDDWELIARDQSTGLTDREGVEVYQSDILKDNVGRIWFIDFIPGGFVYRWSRDPGQYVRHHDFNAAQRPLVVIGSVHENPDLLTQEQG